MDGAGGPGDAGPALQVRGVSKTFGVTRALRSVDLDVRRGEVLALVGGNGSGKSTLVKTLAGVQPADAGELSIRGTNWDLSSFTPARSRSCGLHMVHQHRTTFPTLTVTENLSIGRGFELGVARRIDWRAARRRTRRLIEEYEINARPDDLLSELSPAAHTMVEIARALQDQEGRADGVLVLDEPTATLPPHETAFLLRSMRRFAAAGQAVLFISHRLDEVLEVSDRVTGLRDGTIVGTRATSALDRDGLVELIVGRSVEITTSTPSARVETRPVLSVRGLRGGSVRDVDLDLHPGEIVGVAGLSGSGRSSLLRMLFGAQTPQAGVVNLDGTQVNLSRPAAAIRAGIGFVPEDRASDAVFPDLSVADNYTMHRLRAFTSVGTIRHQKERAAGRAAISALGVKAASERIAINALSGGNQQKISLGRWVAEHPRLLLLDEPTQGVDVGARSDIWEIIRAEAGHGCGVLVVSSDLEELVHLCHRLVIIREGRIVGQLSTGAITADEVNRQLHSLEVGA